MSFPLEGGPSSQRGSGRNRTADLRCFNPALCPLSYRSIGGRQVRYGLELVPSPPRCRAHRSHALSADVPPVGLPGFPLPAVPAYDRTGCATVTGLEPATPASTEQCSTLLSYTAIAGLYGSTTPPGIEPYAQREEPDWRRPPAPRRNDAQSEVWYRVLPPLTSSPLPPSALPSTAGSDVLPSTCNTVPCDHDGTRTRDLHRDKVALYSAELHSH